MNARGCMRCMLVRASAPRARWVKPRVRRIEKGGSASRAQSFKHFHQGTRMITGSGAEEVCVSVRSHSQPCTVSSNLSLSLDSRVVNSRTCLSFGARLGRKGLAFDI